MFIPTPVPLLCAKAVATDVAKCRHDVVYGLINDRVTRSAALISVLGFEGFLTCTHAM